MKTKHLLICLTLFSIFLNSSCEGPEGDAGPAGPAGESYNPTQEWVYKEGNAKGTATGTLLDGTPFSYNLDFQGNYEASNNSYKITSPTETVIEIHKMHSGEGDAFVYAAIYAEFRVTSLSNLSSPMLNSISIEWTKDLGSNKYHRTYYNYYSTVISGASGTISGLAYNSGTGILTGNYTLTSPANAGNGSFNIANGTFSTKLSNVVARKAAK